jgi:hypothetical protein
MPRPRRRTPNYDFVLYDSDISLGYRVNGRISFDCGERMELAGRAVRVYEDVSGKHVGWQKVAERPKTGGAPADPTPELMCEAEMHLVAGQAFVHSRSRTMRLHMNDPRRLTRVWNGKLLPPEDDVERAVAKLQCLTPRHLQAAV